MKHRTCDWFLGDNQTCMSRLHTEQLRDDIYAAIVKIGRPARCKEIAKIVGCSPVAIGKCIEQYSMRTFRVIQSSVEIPTCEKTIVTHYVGLNDQLARFEPTYHPFGHLNLEQVA